MLENGTLLQDRFLIEEPIGVGGMGAVYLATDQKFGSKVAIKQTAFDNPELIQAFEREARLLNTLHHPVLPHVSDFFAEDGTQLLVMEYIEGEDLSEILKRGERLGIDDILRWTFELLDALDYLHSHEPPIVHRDIKPNNLKLTPRGNIVLLDFGLAKETSASTAGMRSVFGYSRRYSPLEQIEGTGTDTRSDIFSLGATIFHLLTGDSPPDVLARASAIVAGRPDPLRLASDINTRVPVELASIVYSALSLNADDRFVSASAMRTALEAAFSHAGVSDVTSEALGPAAPGTAEPEAPAEPALDVPAEEHVADAAEEESVIPLLAKVPFSDGVSGEPSYTSAPWFRPALAAAVLVVLTTLGFGIYNSLQETEPRVEAAPSGLPADPPASKGQLTGSQPGRSRDTKKSDDEQSEPETARTDNANALKNDSGDTASSERSDANPDEPAATKRAERPTVPRAQRQPEELETDQPPVATIETIFTGRPASEPTPDDISNEERLQRKRERQKKGKRPIRPF
ncbi:MAG TPA: protein kinase [Pyrinomonadaceae bacterium]|nr:protein kinase [Pyrinomonadaceae bacterium]